MSFGRTYVKRNLFKIPDRTTRTMANWCRNKLDPLQRSLPLHKDNEHLQYMKHLFFFFFFFVYFYPAANEFRYTLNFLI